MKIGTLPIPGKTFLAPLAGITNLPFRLLVKSCGCAVVCSEMISAKGLFYQQKKTFDMLASDPLERPLSIQLFGSDAISMAKAARMIEAMNIADIIDINFGCSVKKVIKTGAGAALMKDPANAEIILRSVRDAVSMPLTIKIRSGWDPTGSQAFETARIAQDAGVNALVIHPRTAGQGFKGHSDWNLIKELKKKCTIPVIGNGDIKTPEDALRMIDQTGCDAVMVGRAAMGNPFIFSQIESLLDTGTYSPPALEDILIKMAELTRSYIIHFGERPACKMLRGRLAWFVKGWPGSSSFRARLSEIESEKQVLNLIQMFRDKLN